MLARVLLAAAALAAGLAVANRRPPPLPPDARADRVVVDKSDRALWLLAGPDTLARYRVALGAAPAGHKAREGDERTPEGRYEIDARNARSRYHRSLRVSYPDAADRARAEAAGVDPGGQVMLHGLPNGLGWLGRLHRLWDWTDGCVAVTDAEMAQVWAAVPTGTPVEIRP